MNDLLLINVTMAVAACLFAHPVAAGDNWWDEDGGREEYDSPAPAPQWESQRMIEEMAEGYRRDLERERRFEYEREMDKRLEEMEDRQRELEEMQRRPSYDELFNRRY